MQSFTEQSRVEPRKRDASARIKDYKEIYDVYDKKDAALQSDRCVQCGDPYCHNRCPLHNYIPFWLKSVSMYDKELSFKLSNETNPFPEITGRICPQDRLCEGDCTLNDGHGAITIGSVETFISEDGFKNGLKPYFPGITSDKSVAVIGSGPASIACATYLLRAGIKVNMYEKANKAGGLLTYGIPSFKLEKEVVQRRVRWLQEAGMQLHLSIEVGRDISFDKLSASNDAIFIGIGAESSKKAKIAHEDASGVFLAIEFLKNTQQKLFNEPYDKKFLVHDKNVVVIGGGDTAMDCLRTSIREGAKSVTCVYRRDKSNMPGSKKEFKNAMEEGAEFIFNVSPKEVLINSNGECIGIEVEKTIMTAKDKSGRSKCEVVKGSHYRIDADIVIFALGFDPQVPSFLAENGIETNNWGGIIVDKNYETTSSGIYAGGDCYRGSDLVVTAAYDGQQAAFAIADKLFS